jgi:cysteine desulfurase
VTEYNRFVSRIYLDHAATTPIDPVVRQAMMPWLSERFHNPSSLYAGAREARMAIDNARDTLAEALGCLSGEIVFTSSGTEAANLALVGTALAYRGSSRTRILISAAEHHCVIYTKPLLESFGFRVELLAVESDASLSPGAVEEAMSDDVLLVAAMHANNETGAISDVDRIGVIAREHGALYFCDAVQTFGLLPVPSADMIAISAHKLYGPKGIGALVVRAGIKPQPTIVGGGQEREMRAGTENVAGIVGFGTAVRLAMNDEARAARISASRDRFEAALSSISPIFTQCTCRLPGHSHLRIPGHDAESMLINLDLLGVDAGSGAACSSGSIEPSHVLLAAGWPESEAKEALRFTFGKDTTVTDAEEAASRVAHAVRRYSSASAKA